MLQERVKVILEEKCQSLGIRKDFIFNSQTQDIGKNKRLILTQTERG